METRTPDYFRYWGKASPSASAGPAFHLLPFHCLDVAACGQEILRRYSLEPLARDLGWTRQAVEALFVFFLALHDLGKFARSFQGLMPSLSSDLVPAVASKRYTIRHDTLGWLLWRDALAESVYGCFLPGASDAADAFWATWVRSAVGHHGKPPQEAEGGGLIELDITEHYLRADQQAAYDFVEGVAWLLPDTIPEPQDRHVQILKHHAWRLAGMAVLADWLGSNQVFFDYRDYAQPLDEYWTLAQRHARHAVASAGLQPQRLRRWDRPLAMFEYVRDPTPLQQYAATVSLEPGPQLFLLEDVTGAGKTEAAITLCQRLMQHGRAQGVYFALPSMATANQMYDRVGQIHRKLFADGMQPSLVLAHGARHLVEAFRQSVLQFTDQPSDLAYRQDERSASLTCNAWLADNRKKALLADVGVGTLDQALLSILPTRHQSLRLLGLSDKVLIVDEVHGYDAYMTGLLRTLLVAHARQGGSAILLSATLPLEIRNTLIDSFRAGLGVTAVSAMDILNKDDRRYPLAMQVGRDCRPHACKTRPQVRRTVQVRMLHEVGHVLALIDAQAQEGHCVAWIRNTVDDAREAARQLTGRIPADNLLLFHSRYTLHDRLDIEADVLDRFGKHSRGRGRAGKVLIGTQVLEQSLDFDVDVMVTDLAPIDLIIQRAGRLQRHTRQAAGDPDEVEQRPPPVLYVFGPIPVDTPAADWYAAPFPKGRHVYPDAGKLWLGARALQQAGCIVTPGDANQPGAVRALVEAVYGLNIEAIPDALLMASQQQIGKDLAMESQAHFNSIDLSRGYCIDSSVRWYEDYQVPTRLDDETLTIYLAAQRDGLLSPWHDGPSFSWDQSAVRLPAHYAQALAPQWQDRFAADLQALRGRDHILEEPAFILPLVETDGRWIGQVQNGRGQLRTLWYDRSSGLNG